MSFYSDMKSKKLEKFLFPWKDYCSLMVVVSIWVILVEVIEPGSGVTKVPINIHQKDPG